VSVELNFDYLEGSSGRCRRSVGASGHSLVVDDAGGTGVGFATWAKSGSSAKVLPRRIKKGYIPCI
jgi:hypothetical protein